MQRFIIVRTYADQLQALNGSSFIKDKPVWQDLSYDFCQPLFIASEREAASLLTLAVEQDEAHSQLGEGYNIIPLNVPVDHLTPKA